MNTKNELQDQINCIFSEMENLLEKSQNYDSAISDQAITELIEMPLEIKYRSGWSHNPEQLEVSEMAIVLTVGGPHIELICQVQNGRILDAEFRGCWWSEWYHFVPEGVKPDTFDQVCSDFVNFFLEGVAI
tara:strand:- start:158 stop:550 length:393 start_codon:yes stop_codon:yes gene_type:complete